MNSFRLSACRRLVSIAAFGLALIGLAGVPVLTGCGGSSSNAAPTGSATLNITWPDAADSRLIPVAAKSIQVVFTRNGTFVTARTIARPTTGNQTSVTFDSLPLGDLTLQALARPNADGSGVTQASATTTVTIVANQNTTVSVTMASTIQSLTLAPTSGTVFVGQTLPLSVVALDANGSIVLTAPSQFTWTSLTPALASVGTTGIVTGGANGPAQIQVTDNESGKIATVNVTVNTTTDCSLLTGTAAVVCRAEAFKSTLSAGQQSAVQLDFTQANATRWSNLPVSAANPRNGLQLGTLSSAQLASAVALAQTALSTAGYSTFDGIRQADAFLNVNGGGAAYGSGIYYIAFLGTPSNSSTWMLQIAGHHYALNLTYNGTTVSGTPYFTGVEPASFTLNGVTYAPLNAKRDAIYAAIQSLDATQRSTAQLATAFNDVLVGPGQDGRFPAQQGILVSSLTTAQQTLVKTAIEAWVRDLPTTEASALLADYESATALGQTYIAWSGATTPTVQGSYVRIDGPRVWIEFVCQNGVVFPGQIHYHTIWRDKTKDYGGSFTF